MSISVFGLGYVGAVTAGCLAHKGNEVIGVDVHPRKVEEVNQGRAPIVEPELEPLLQAANASGRLAATTSCEEAVAASEVSIVCVGTPSLPSGELDLGIVTQVTRDIGKALEKQPKRHVIIYRCTMLPGSTRRLVREELAAHAESGRLEVYFQPEFLREGSAVKDFEDPSLLVVGTEDGKPPPAQRVKWFGIEAEAVDWETAEMVKYACNAFHALKITFANEIGRISKHIGVDSRQVMELLCEDDRLNISPYYLRPGNPFGGSCLPKDVKALNAFSRSQNLRLPVLDNLMPSNGEHLQGLLQRIRDSGQKEVVILGLSFKVDTDDLRESAMVEVAQYLLGRGYTLRIYDPQLNLKQLVGTNKRMVEEKLPHLASFLYRDFAAAIGARGVILAAQRCASIQEMKRNVSEGHHIIDINGWPELRELPGRYEGLCW